MLNKKSLQLFAIDYFCKTFPLRCLTGFWIHIFDLLLTDYLSCFVVVLREIHRKGDTCQKHYSIHSKLRIFLFWSHTCKYNIQGNERLTKVKEKWWTISFDFFYFFFHFLCSNILDNKCQHQTSCACAGVCAGDHMYQMGKTAECFLLITIKLRKFIKLGWKKDG